MTSYCINWIDPVLLTLLKLSPLVRSKVFQFTRIHPVDLYSIYSLRYQFIHSLFSVQCSVFIVFICYCSGIVLKSQRNQDVANILHVFTYTLAMSMNFIFHFCNSIQSTFHTLIQFSIHPTATDILFPAQFHSISVVLDDAIPRSRIIFNFLLFFIFSLTQHSI